jgi:hypothetical protein
MPVCDARTQNGDRAFSYMVIENIFISGSGSLIHIILLRCYCETLAIIASLNFCSKSIGRRGWSVERSAGWPKEQAVVSGVIADHMQADRFVRIE